MQQDGTGGDSQRTVSKSFHRILSSIYSSFRFFQSTAQSKLSNLRRVQDKPEKAHRERSQEAQKLFLRPLRPRALQQAALPESHSCALPWTREVLEMRFCDENGTSAAKACGE